MFRLIGFFAQGRGGGSAPILMMVAIFGIFYFLLIMPQQRQQKKWQAMLTQVKSGDRVITSGGLTGIIMSAKDDTVVLRVPPDNIKLEIARVLDRDADDRRGAPKVLAGLQSPHEQESPRQNSSHYRGAGRFSVRHLRHSQQLHAAQGLLAALQKRIHLGLDLKGGTHLILQVQVNDAVNADTDRAIERLKDDLQDGQRSSSARSPSPIRSNNPERHRDQGRSAGASLATCAASWRKTGCRITT